MEYILGSSCCVNLIISSSVILKYSKSPLTPTGESLALG